MLPDLVNGLAHHTPRLELPAACAALGLRKAGTLEALAGRAAGWVNDAVEVDLRRKRTESLLSHVSAATIQKLAG